MPCELLYIDFAKVWIGTEEASTTSVCLILTGHVQWCGIIICEIRIGICSFRLILLMLALKIFIHDPGLEFFIMQVGDTVVTSGNEAMGFFLMSLPSCWQ